jgi:hypothetical protein
MSGAGEISFISTCSKQHESPLSLTREHLVAGLEDGYLLLWCDSRERSLPATEQTKALINEHLSLGNSGFRLRLEKEAIYTYDRAMAISFSASAVRISFSA